MSITISRAKTIVFGLSVCSLALILTVPVAGSHQGKDHSDEKTKTKSQTKTEVKKSPSYKYTAQPGDSYTLMARKAVQTYGITEKVSLSPAQVIFAETNLTITAGSPSLNKGAKVTIAKDDVKKWVDAAQKITPAKEVLWATYVPYVEFNTNKVGEA